MSTLPDYDSPNWSPTPKDYMVLHLAMLGQKPSEIGHQTQLPSASVKALLASPWAKEQITQYHDRFMRALQEKVFEPTQKFYSKLEQKIEQLDAMTQSENPSTALRAIEIWIAHTIGSPVKRTEVQVNHSLNNLSTAELEFVRAYKRLPTAEERLQLQNPALQLDYIDSTAHPVTE